MGRMDKQGHYSLESHYTAVAFRFQLWRFRGVHLIRKAYISNGGLVGVLIIFSISNRGLCTHFDTALSRFL